MTNAPQSRKRSTTPSLTPSPKAASQTALTEPLPATLRQMIAVLEKERQALATLDADELFEAAREKDTLCDVLAPVVPEALDHETRPLVETAQQLNDVNRRVRNLLAANVASRLEALGAPRAAYQAGHNRSAYGHAYNPTSALGMNP